MRTSSFGEDKDKLHAALALLYLFPGEPSIFYGTEVYTPGGYDPDCRRCMDWEAADKDLKVKELLKKLSDIRKKCKFSFDGTRIYASEDGRLLCIERHGKKGDARLIINQTDETGIDKEIQVDPKGFRLFINGGEMV